MSTFAEVTAAIIKNKHPTATLDYMLDWTPWLEGDAILTSTWTVPTGLTKDSESFTEKTTTVWLSGGSDGTQYTVVNRITTVLGRIETKSIRFSITSTGG